jgi:hypothetical protein
MANTGNTGNQVTVYAQKSSAGAQNLTKKGIVVASSRPTIGQVWPRGRTG